MISYLFPDLGNVYVLSTWTSANGITDQRRSQGGYRREYVSADARRRHRLSTGGGEASRGPDEEE